MDYYGPAIDKAQVIYKFDSTFYLQLLATGRIHEIRPLTDSTYSFKRVDRTVNLNYNIGSLSFNHKNDIYNYGGYGFWKNHGNLIKFNWKDKEWDISPLNQEVIPHNNLNGTSWYDPVSHSLYVPYESIVNAGITGDENLTGVLSHTAWHLNIAEKKWEKLGVSNLNATDLLKKTTIIVPADSGMIISSTFDLYYFNFKNNSSYICLDKSLVQSFSRMNSDKFSYYFNNHIYFYDAASDKYDSLQIKLNEFKKLDFPIWEKENKTSLLPFILLAGAGSLMFTYYLIKSKKKKRTKKITDIPETINFKINFNDTELALINLLINNIPKNKKATITEINYVLGLKDKNTGLQKKVRSDVMNNINSKYKYFLKKDTQLIQSVRSELDKRYFEYYIDESEQRSIKNIIKEITNEAK